MKRVLQGLAEAEKVGYCKIPEAGCMQKPVKEAV